MANDGDTLRSTIRANIGDDDDSGTERFDDNKINTFIATALRRLNRRVGITVTISDGTLSSEPNDAQFDLIVLQTECLIAHRERYNAARKGVRVRQDENEVDTSAGLNAFNEAVSGEGGVCAQLEEAIAQYLSTGVSISSATTQGAEAIWSGNQKLYEDVDHDGQGSERVFTPRPNNRNNLNSGVDGIDGSSPSSSGARFTDDGV